MFCSKCGTQNADTAATCSKCGAPLGGSHGSSAAGDKMKSAGQDAWKAFTTFATNPVGGLAAAAEALGPARAMSVGIVFGVAFTVLTGFGLYRVFPLFMGSGVGWFIKMLVVAAVPFVSLVGACWVVRKVFGGEGGTGIDFFISGASLLPFGIVALLASLLGAGNFDLIYALSLFAVCFTILMLFAGLTRICRVSERSATLAVPLMLMVSAWLAKVIYSAMLSNM